MERDVRSQRPGFTLIEAVVSMVIVGVIMVAALNTVWLSRRNQFAIDREMRGQLLAHELMAEILAQSYEEPVDAVGFGPEAPELATSRSAWDDVDDYDNWSASPPVAKDGTAITGLTGWKRAVAVERVNVKDPKTAVVAESGSKRITVIVYYNDIESARVVAVRTREL